MILGIITLITALSISAVAIYYSVAGLVAIFAASAVSIIIMGSVLEVSKLVATVWLHRYWDETVLWLRIYLCISIVLLMLITSMGIFGFLSKAHIEQASAGQESVAQLARIENEIARRNAVIDRADQKLQKTETSGTSADTNIQTQIDREQARIDGAYTRIYQAEQRLVQQLAPYKQELVSVDTVLSDLQTAITSNNIRKAQSIAGTNPDGSYGPKTAAAIQSFRDAQNNRRQELLATIQEIRSQDASANLARKQIEDSNGLITRLRAQLGQDTSTDLDSIVDEQNARIRVATLDLDKLTEQKYTIQANFRKLEAEVGPIKYIAEFIYGGKADKEILETAVSWMIVLIIITFDPLAVALLLASQYTLKDHYAKKNETKSRLAVDLRKRRAPAEAVDEYRDYEVNELGKGTDGNEWKIINGQMVKVSNNATSTTPGSIKAAEEEEEEEEEDKYLVLTTEEEQRKAIYNSFDELVEWKEAKHNWKMNNPTLTIKEQKNRYIKGYIDKLPWDDHETGIFNNTPGRNLES